MYNSTQSHAECKTAFRSARLGESVLAARGRECEIRPVAEWQAAVRRATSKMRHRLEFMTAGHHAVRNYVVAALPRCERPLPVREIAARTGLAAPRVQAIVEELERNWFFLVRNAAGEVAWAFPVTADRTPHEMKLGAGERAFGACAEDAFAAAFVLGRLLRRRLRVEIQSVCGQSDHPLRLTVDSDLSWRANTKGARPLLFVPSLNWEGFRGPNIINDY